MKRITKISVQEYRSLLVAFDDGKSGIFHVKDRFTGIAGPLNDRNVFNTAKIINKGHGVGFDGTEYDICSELIYAELVVKPATKNRRTKRRQECFA
ncbi:MAG: hypothetical protein A2268_12660 [Candidatus Raymondbacteria bacterium RifOxyA12_full_50_37]|uniref:DUF2442 domain-containing protein n=1 Tax=Candidatus Raymondbacteria bacterium RIFOXYD12_FULL_49_13 TaxID=1817890 RepID=A0A1F7FB34_UNCRA|nr:MAG: hypothetical protein A2268_12660 [Candidatus Raymondbacteria bacterium RifOxyA12_full_50_37]OGJ91027.1 MAG: hypothetical protein A2248_00680 [Candidatus Raymondbacteria bacterium RIFOXYA2_FULL_49_16]OGJ97464.1 MAG: hypothetical protein A2453_10230 [Candidatus Raymondbacteria bacterium RIFOXYC2_FULL_50_21]OGJ97790.1 MAG: hypothetical protein A2487_13235 [Candidatus Raymondbacteria bacterium RifOxyC12_full_50_8]OGJ99728.1 MAG: hypothetical protein A2350_08935 [Candidatus Raymondbacteria b